ncbi:hypothetical protein KUCAC02_021130, partial [Chaenocephalus aceratus]
FTYHRHCQRVHRTLPLLYGSSHSYRLYGTSLAGYVGFQQNRKIKGQLARASVFALLKGTTAPTGFLGWREGR